MKPGPNRNTKILGIAGFLADASTGMLAPLLPLFLVKVLLAPVLVVGLMERLDGFAAGIPVFLSGPHPGRDAKKKGPVVAGYSLSAIVKCLLASVSSWPQVAALWVLARLGNGIVERPRDDLVTLSPQESGAGRASGFREMLGNMGAAVGPLVAALMLASVSAGMYSVEAYRSVFVLAAAAAVLAVPLLFFVQETPAPQGRPRTPLKDLASAPGMLPFLAFTAVLALGQFSVMFFMLRAADFLPFVLIPVAYLAYSVFHGIFSLPAEILANRLGPRATMLLGMLSLLLALAGAAFHPSLMVLFLAFAFLGIFMAVVKAVPQAFLSKIVRKEDCASAIEAHRALAGMVGLPANILAGLLWTIPLFGAPASFLFSMAATLAAVMLLLLVVKD